jgi:hypothetical protein
MQWCIHDDLIYLFDANEQNCIQALKTCVRGLSPPRLTVHQHPSTLTFLEPLMNLKQLISVSVLAFAGSAAMADDVTVATERSASIASRADVQAGVSMARANGQLLKAGEVDNRATPDAGMARSRDEVRSEARNPAARASFAMSYLPA